RRQLAEWLASKGKTYKRPPMMLLQKQPVKLSCRTKEENEKRREPEQPSSEKIRHLLTECLKLVEEGAQAEDILALLSRVPQAEKFSTFWICRAKLLARSGPFDVTGLYKAAVCAGATPLEELREVVLGILKATAPPSEGGGRPSGSGPQTLSFPFPGEKPEQPLPWDSATPPAGEGRRQAVTPCPTGSALTSLPASIKLQVTSAPRPAEAADARELRFVTPVRRSLRIGGRAGGRYPPMLKDHDPVVASLSEALAAEEEAPRLLFRRNKALP
ncbi:CKP2L protein, partial [Rhinopomastus cyanomelas]|nr:CKP2L protein [Rhinopomastus cyanomelas]